MANRKKSKRERSKEIEKGKELNKELKKIKDKNCDNYYYLYSKIKNLGGKVMSNSARFRFGFPLLESFNNFRYTNETPEPKSEGYFNGISFLFNDYFNCDLFSFSKLPGEITSFLVTSEFVFVALAEDDNLINIFENKTCKSQILVLDHSLKTKKGLEFDYGKILHLKTFLNKVYVLFQNGNIGSIDLDGCFTFSTIKSNKKIIDFEIVNSKLISTDGTHIYSEDRSFNSEKIIIQLISYGNVLYFLDIQGRVCSIDCDLEQSTELTSNYLIDKIYIKNGCLICYSDGNEQAVRQLDSPSPKFSYYFKSITPGIISCIKKQGKKKKIKHFVKIEYKDQRVYINTNNFLNEKSTLTFLEPQGLGNSVFYGYKHGFIFKFNYF